MKNKCIDKTGGSQLHAYELDMLSAEEAEQFEIHLLKCEYCLAQINQLSDVTRILNSDKEVLSKINEFGKELIQTKYPFLSQLKQQFISKPVISTLVVLVLFFTYLEFSFLNNPQPEATQQIRLFPHRSVNSSVQYLSTEKSIELVFGYEGSKIDQCYEVTIYNSEDDMIYENQSFCDFNKLNLGELIVSTDLLINGRYTMTIIDPNGDPLSNTQEYRFTILYK